jgi:hypothetical protein
MGTRTTAFVALAFAALAPLATPAEAQTRFRRPDDNIEKGLYLGIGAGLNIIDYDLYDEGDTNPGIRFQASGGWAITQSFVVLAQGSWGYTDRTQYELRQIAVGAAARGYLTSSLWAQGGIGLGWISVRQTRVSFDSVSAGPGPSFDLALGVDAVRGGHFVFGLELRGSWTTHGDEGTVMAAAVLLDVSWY